MSNREKMPEWIDRFNNGELSGEELQTFLEMAKKDPRLREEIKLDLDLNSILTEEDILDLRKKIMNLKRQRLGRKGNNLKFYLMAASFLLFLGIGLLLFYYKGTRTSNAKSVEIILLQKHQAQLKQHLSVQKPDSSKTSLNIEKKENHFSSEEIGTDLLAGFVKNPSLENLIGTTRHSENFLMVFPINNHHFSANAVARFEWIVDGQAEIELRIMNNSGTPVHESGTIRKNSYSIPSGKLKPGLFYFKILRGDELLYFGKFTIK